MPNIICELILLQDEESGDYTVQVKRAQDDEWRSQEVPPQFAPMVPQFLRNLDSQIGE